MFPKINNKNTSSNFSVDPLKKMIVDKEGVKAKFKKQKSETNGRDFNIGKYFFDFII